MPRIQLALVLEEVPGRPVEPGPGPPAAEVGMGGAAGPRGSSRCRAAAVTMSQRRVALPHPGDVAEERRCRAGRTRKASGDEQQLARAPTAEEPARAGAGAHQEHAGRGSPRPRGSSSASRARGRGRRPPRTWARAESRSASAAPHDAEGGRRPGRARRRCWSWRCGSAPGRRRRRAAGPSPGCAARSVAEHAAGEEVEDGGEQRCPRGRGRAARPRACSRRARPRPRSAAWRWAGAPTRWAALRARYCERGLGVVDLVEVLLAREAEAGQPEDRGQRPARSEGDPQVPRHAIPRVFSSGPAQQLERVARWARRRSCPRTSRAPRTRPRPPCPLLVEHRARRCRPAWWGRRRRCRSS